MSSDLKEQLAALHASLQQTAAVDAQTRELLLQILSDITRLLGAPGGVTEQHPITTRLEELAVQFEAEHPSVGTAVRQLVDALAKAGI
jgi:hypothetical protein